MGQFLLSGWIMLQDSCSTCKCPLFSSKDRKVIKCAVCPSSTETPAAIVAVTKSNTERQDTIVESIDKVCANIAIGMEDLSIRLRNMKSGFSVTNDLSLLKECGVTLQFLKEVKNSCFNKTKFE